MLGPKGTAGQGKRVVSALAVQAGKEGKRLQKRLSAVNPEMIGVSWEQRESKYEEWMKAAIDNVRQLYLTEMRTSDGWRGLFMADAIRKSRVPILGILP